MMRTMTAALVAAATLAGTALQSTTASAIPMIDRAPAAIAQSAAADTIEHVRVVCGPFGCHWRPNYYRPYPVYGYHYGWRRHYHPYFGYHHFRHHRHW